MSSIQLPPPSSADKNSDQEGGAAAGAAGEDGEEGEQRWWRGLGGMIMHPRWVFFPWGIAHKESTADVRLYDARSYSFQQFVVSGD